jgi:splicing factor U2AF subunit
MQVIYSLKSWCVQIFVRFLDLLSARKAQLMMNGRRFDGTRVVCAAFYPLDKYIEKQYTLSPL